jgi:hypothetical protein
LADPVETGLLQQQPAEAADPRMDAMKESVLGKVQEMMGLSYPSAVNPGVQVPDSDFDAIARTATENHKAQEAKRQAVFHRDVVPPPDPDSGVDSLSIMRNGANFLFHDPMALMGMTWDKDGVHERLDTARDMVVNHPWRAGLAAASTFAPIAAGASRLMKAGAAAEIGTSDLMMAGLVDSAEDYANMTQKGKDLVQAQAQQVGNLRALRTAVQNNTATTAERAKLNFYEAMGNTYLDAHTNAEMQPGGTMQAWNQQAKELTSGRALNDMMELAGNVKKDEGTKILLATKDPARLSDLSPEGREFALEFSAKARDRQAAMLDSGFIDDETAKKVGDMWFSTLRKDSPLFEEGASTDRLIQVRRNSAESAANNGRLQVINLPRTGSPHMFNRSMDEEGVTNLLKRQQAADYLLKGKKDAALNLLDHPDDADAVSLINSGKNAEAAKHLESMSGGFIESDPQELVARSMLQPELLHLNYKTIRDVAMNPAITKTQEEFEAMTPAMRRYMVPLDKMENSNVIRRMVAKSQGKATVDNLGYVHSKLFDEMGGIIKKETTAGAVDWMRLLTAIHKTAKTSLNPFSHGQNTGGNGVFLSMAGFHPWEPENFSLLRTAWKSVGEWHAMRRGGKAIEEIADLGQIESKTGGKAINIAEEMQDPILSGPHGILDMSSMEQSEGIPSLARMYNEAPDHAVFMKKFISGVQAVAKAKLPGMKEGWAEKAGQLYSAEDSATKLGYFLHLRANGMNRVAAANEVARRLPMYNTIGQRAAGARKAFLPWISFPIETARIMKNNIMDYPLRTAMWMHVPNLVQAGASMPFGRSYEQTEDLKKQNPMWAQKSSAIVTPFRDKNDQLRTMMLDVMPWTAMAPQSEAQDADTLEKLPFGLGNPYPIVMGLVNAMTGKSSYGQDMPADPNSSTSKMQAAVMNTMGFLAPPLVQKYLLNPTAPSPTFRIGQDAGKNVNPSTGVTGDWMFDAALSNTVMKNYAGSPMTQIANERYGARKIDAYRGDLGRKYSAWVRSGDWNSAGDVLRSVYQSYLQDTPDNPGLAWQRYTDWQQSHARELEKNPGLKGISRQEFLRKIRETGNSVAPVLNEARQDYKQALIQGYYGAAGSGSRGGNVLTRGTRSGGRSDGRSSGRDSGR